MVISSFKKIYFIKSRGKFIKSDKYINGTVCAPNRRNELRMDNDWGRLSGTKLERQ